MDRCNNGRLFRFRDAADHSIQYESATDEHDRLLGRDGNLPGRHFRNLWPFDSAVPKNSTGVVWIPFRFL